MKVGINGFGRIGKNIYKICAEHRVEVPLVNDPFIDIEYMAYLLKYDTVTGRLDCHIEDDAVVYRGKRTRLCKEKTQGSIPWAEYGIDYVVEATGVFMNQEECEKHKCKRVVLTAPGIGIPMFVYGVNHEKIDAEKVISAASCTTNCLAPLAKLLSDEYGIEEGLMTTVHSVTATQKITDAKGPKWRSARSALNIIPATTGAARAVCKVLPELEGRINGMAFRVPVINVSVVDFVVRLRRETSLEEIRKLIDRSDMPGIIGWTDSPVVSSDFNGDSRSSILDLGASMEMNSRFFKLISWYDNEYGYSARVVDLMMYMASKDK